MAKFILEKDEANLFYASNVFVFANDLEYKLDVYITNKRLVLLKEVSKELDNAGLISRGIQFPLEYEMYLDLKKEEIKNVLYNGEYNHLVLKDNKELDIFCEDMSSYLK